MVKKSKNRYTVYKYLICHSRKVLEKLEINLENAAKMLEFDFGKGVGTLLLVSLDVIPSAVCEYVDC